MRRWGFFHCSCCWWVKIQKASSLFLEISNLGCKKTLFLTLWRTNAVSKQMNWSDLIQSAFCPKISIRGSASANAAWLPSAAHDVAHEILPKLEKWTTSKEDQGGLGGAAGRRADVHFYYIGLHSLQFPIVMVNSSLLELLQNVAASHWEKHIISDLPWARQPGILTRSSGINCVLWLLQRKKDIHICHTLIVCPSVSCSFWIYGLRKGERSTFAFITQLLILFHRLQKFYICCKVSFNP